MANVKSIITNSQGNVLINTETDTGHKLSVNGTALFSDKVSLVRSGSNDQLLIKTSSNNGSRIGHDSLGLYFSNDDTSLDVLRIYGGASGVLRFSIDSSGVLYNNSGYLAYGDGTFTSLFAPDANGGITMGDATGPINVYYNDTHTFQSAGQLVNYGGFTSTGFGVGTVAPSSKLEVVKQGNASGGTMLLSGSKTNNQGKFGIIATTQYASDTETEGVALIGGINISTENIVVVGGGIDELNTATSIRFFAAANTTTRGSTNEKMRINSSGNVLIGTGTDSGYKLDVNGNTRIQGSSYVTSRNYISLAGDLPIAYKIPYTQLAGGTVVSDNLANGGSAKVAYSTDTPGTFFFGPYSSIEPGSYVAKFRLKVASNASSSSIGAIDVAGTNIAANSLLLRPSMFPTSGEYYYFSVPFTVGPAASGSVETRWLNWPGGVTDAYVDHVFIESAQSEAEVYVPTSKDFNVYADGTSRMVVKNGGNVGIGTTSPSYKLQISDTAANGRAVQAVQTATSGTNYGAVLAAEGVGATKNVGLYANAIGATTNHAAIFANGNVGIGTTDPTEILHVKSPGNNGGVWYTVFLGQNSTGYQNAFQARVRDEVTDLGAYIVGTNTGSNLSFSVQSNGGALAEAGRFAKTGNFLIGTNNDAGYKLDVNGTGRFSGDLRNTWLVLRDDALEEYKTASDTGGVTINYVGYNSGTSYFRDFKVFNGKGSQLFKITGSTGEATFSGSQLIIANANASLYFTNGTADYGNGSAIGRASTNGFHIGGSIAGDLCIGAEYGKGIIFGTGASGTLTQRMKIDTTGSIRFNSYGSGTYTGTPTYNLGVDASGNVIELPGGVVDGSGTANYVSKWSDANTLTDSVIYDNGTNVGIGTLPNQGVRLQVAGAVDAWNSLNTLLRLSHDGTRGKIQSYTGGAVSPTALNADGGNVLIGTDTDNGSKLNVNGSYYGTGNITLITAGYPLIDLGVTTSNYFRINFDNPNDQLIIGKNGASSFILNASGAATFSSSVALSAIFNSTSNTPYIRFDESSNAKFFIGQRGAVSGSGGTGYDFYSVAGNDIRFFAGGSSTTALCIDTSQNVGIGTTGPDSLTHIVGSTAGDGGTFNGGGSILHVKQNTGWSGAQPWALFVEGYSYLNGFRINAADGIRGLYKTASGGQLGFATAGDDPITFAQNAGDYRLYIAAGGNLIVGSSTDAGYKLDVHGEILGRDDIRIFNTYALVLNGSDANWRIGRNTITDSGWLTGNTMQMVVFGGSTGQGFQVVNTNGTALFEIDGVAGASRFTNALGVGVDPSGTAGRIDASNDIVAYSTSDQRLKENITPIANALDKVKALNGVEFDWKEETKAVHGYEGHDVGVIAQEVQAVLPEAVRTNDSGYLSVRYEKMIGLLVEAMKEQQGQIDELKAKLDGLTK